LKGYYKPQSLATQSPRLARLSVWCSQGGRAREGGRAHTLQSRGLTRAPKPKIKQIKSWKTNRSACGHGNESLHLHITQYTRSERRDKKTRPCRWGEGAGPQGRHDPRASGHSTARKEAVGFALEIFRQVHTHTRTHIYIYINIYHRVAYRWKR